ncbi:MAG TPA: SRPBCC family protein [Anaerolineales bacterium]
MRTFELNIFIDCKRNKIYDHLSEPINMIGLQPRITEIDVLKKKKDGEGVAIHPFNTVETFRWLGIPLFRSKVYSAIHLTTPKKELELRVHREGNIEIVFKYRFHQFNDGRTQITQTMQIVKAGKLLENFVVSQAKQAQRALLSNLKVRLEKY